MAVAGRAIQVELPGSFQECKQFQWEITKKVKTPLYKRILSPMKGRRKDKDAPLQPPDENKLYLTDDYVRESIGRGELEKYTTCPAGLDQSEWIASNTISFFEHVNLMYGSVSEFCTSTGCNTMAGPGNQQYYWFDEKGKKCKCAAPQYIDYVMTYTQKTVQDESVFPTKYGNVFPNGFEERVRKVHRYLYHVMAHIYQAHYKEILALHLHPHLNTLFKHFMLFSRQYNLLEDDTDSLNDLYTKLTEDKENVLNHT